MHFLKGFGEAAEHLLTLVEDQAEKIETQREFIKRNTDHKLRLQMGLTKHMHVQSVVDTTSKISATDIVYGTRKIDEVVKLDEVVPIKVEYRQESTQTDEEK